MTDPGVSCVIPTHNGERYLALSIRSVLEQTHPVSDIIVVDDGSTDGSARIIDSFGPPVRRVSVSRGGPAAARNRGTAESRSDFIAFLDHDDLWHPRKIERQRAAFRRNPSLDLCLTDVEIFWGPEMTAARDRYADLPRATRVPGYATISLLARRAAFDTVGPLDETLWYADAVDWFLRAERLGLKSKIIPDLLVRHRMHANNLTRLGVDASIQEFLALTKRHLDHKRGDQRGVRVEHS